MQRLGYSWYWVNPEVGEEAHLCATSPKLDPVRAAPTNQNKRVFFNQVVAQLANAEEWNRRQHGDDSVIDQTKLNQFIQFGDGSAVSVDVLKEARKICEECAVELQWEAGDVALLDNYLVMHARRDFEGPRRVLASLVR
eukprot:TRINITY_DN55578_c0_g2_i1.p2 TRINITY_DN55578_c0_g2~~TRINITY_DN55578_c0_g2_i1.p2  ORF type:complete len:157 (-),score=16.44 TRINITY_DN55578_c0_g2_i1:156-572(-)